MVLKEIESPDPQKHLTSAIQRCCGAYHLKYHLQK